MTYGEFAKIYDKLINEDIDYKKICDRIQDIMKEYHVNNEDYLDLACGTANVTEIMAEKFHNIYAVDLSEDMLSKAYDKLSRKNIQAQIICQDMSCLNLNKKFDLITCVLDSTNYIIDDEDVQNYFKGVYNHLKDEGIFIFDMNSYYKLSNILGNNTYVYNEEDVFYSWENYFEDEVVNMFLTFFVKNKDLYEKFEEEHCERAYKEEFIERLLKKCGFKEIEKFDGYTSGKVKEDSERILYVVRK